LIGGLDVPSVAPIWSGISQGLRLGADPGQFACRRLGAGVLSGRALIECLRYRWPPSLAPRHRYGRARSEVEPIAAALRL